MKRLECQSDLYIPDDLAQSLLRPQAKPQCEGARRAFMRRTPGQRWKSGPTCTICASAQKGGFHAERVYSGTRIENILEMVGQGMGVSLLMEAPVRYAAPKGIEIVPLSEDLFSHITLVRLRKHRLSIASEAFWYYVKERSDARP